MPTKVSGCGTIVSVDFGGGFQVIGLIDAVTPWSKSKTVIDTPTLDCASAAEVGRQENSIFSFGHFWDLQDADHEALDTNFENSTSDGTLKDLPVQLTTPGFSSGGGAVSTVTLEATCQISAITPEEVTPEGHYKRQISFLRNGAITKTVTAV